MSEPAPAATVDLAMNPFVVMTSEARGTGDARKFGRYKNVAVVQTDGEAMPAMISNRAKHLVKIVRHYGSCSVGSTDRCEFARALADANTLCDRKNAEHRAAQSNVVQISDAREAVISKEAEPMAERFSIYAGDPVMRLLDYTGEKNRSGRLNDVVSRYLAIIEHELAKIKFTQAEWSAICDANNGSMMSGMSDDLAWRNAWANVADDPDLDAKWGIDSADLVKRMRALSLAGRAAVAEVIERFWPRCRLPAEEAFRLAGVTFAAE